MHYLVDFKNSTTDTEIQTYLQAINATVLKNFNNFEKVYHIDVASEPPVTEIVEFLVRDDDAPLQLLNTIIEANKNFGKIVTDGSVPTIDITNEEKNWWKFYTLSDPDLDTTTVVTNRRGDYSTVYILDSGIEITHPEFLNTSVENLWSFTDNFTDTKGHGTAIASVIAGSTCGLTNAKLKSVKIFEQGVATKQSDMLSALDAIYDDFVTNNFNTEFGNAIVNASWSISKNEYIEHKIRLMSLAGIYFVVSAGNDGSPISDRTPASMPEVLTIGAYNNNLLPCDFSNYTGTSSISLTQGTTNHGALDGWAPGEQIWAAGLSGTYGYVSGTSIAAAIVSSCLAYNFSTGNNEPIMGQNYSDYFYAHALFRENLLDLTDPKYSSSKNGIATIRDTYPPSFGRRNPVVKSVKMYSNVRQTLQIFSPWQIKQLEVIGDLPPGFHINTAGKLYGIAPELTGTERYKEIKIPMKATYDDLVEESYDFTIYVVAADWDPSVETTGDPTLDIILAAQIFCVFNGPQCIASVNVCVDACTQQLVCDTGVCGTKGQESCTCIL